jgi:hypothetical protein
MEKAHLIILVMVFALSLPFYAAASLGSDKKANVGVLSYSNLKLADFINLSPGDVIKITGRKMSVLDKISFNIMKYNMKKALRKNPDLSAGEYYTKMQNQKIGTGGVIFISFFGFLLIILLIFLIAFSSSSFH